MKRYIAISISLLALSSCSMDKMRLETAHELGTDRDIYEVKAEGGVASVQVYTNAPGSLDKIGNESWIHIDNPSFTQDAVIGIRVDANSGARRSAEVQVSNDVRKDTLTIRQEGAYEEQLELVSSSVLALNGAGDTKVDISTNISPSDIKFRIVYLDAGVAPWVTGVRLQDSQVVISTQDNPDEKKTRKAVIEIKYRDGWGEDLDKSLYVTQANALNKVGNEISFEELHALVAGGESVSIEDDYTLEGYVVSDKECGNSGEPDQQTSTTIDYTLTGRTVYFESLDGGHGVMMEFYSEADNILNLNDKAIINLEGADLFRYENPTRYVLRGLTSSMVVSSTSAGEGEIPVKLKRMSELTDSDIYTRVTLKDCEFPIRKGSLTPINEGYAMLYKAHRITKFPTLIRDIEGSSMYMYTNTNCPYRRDGSRMGYGSGSVTGVVVHEKYRRFIDKDAADEDDCGNIGRYQIRHMKRADLAFADNFHDSFSEMICEWRYLTVATEDNKWNATYGSGTMDHSYAAVNPTFQTNAYPVYDYSYLGPDFVAVNSALKTNEAGFGIILEDGTNFGQGYITNNFPKYLDANNEYPLAWMAHQWWNSTRSGPEYWTVHFSTKGISTDQLSMQVAMLNTTQEGKGPNQWHLLWSTGNGVNATWTVIPDSEFSVPDVVLNSVTQPWQCPGFKPMNFVLPLEMLDKDDVYIRIMPRNRKASSPSGYLDTEIANGTAGASGKANSGMDYLAIRYNK